VKAFFDTNVIVYAFDPPAGLRHARALGLVEQHALDNNLVISTQVLQESYSVLTRKRGVPAEVARTGLTQLASQQVVPSSAVFVLEAIAFAEQQQLSIWDALVVTAAIESRCDVLVTEDLQSGRRYGNLEVVNPFQLGAHESAPAAPVPAQTRPRRPVASRSQRL
jgi:predicted nucleic acid-binding protein